MAAVILNEGATLDILGLREFCRQKLAPYKIPARIVAVDSLPRTALGKVQRRLAREQLLGSGSSLISHD
jgi:long-chain acyl-CoA synthetase